MGYVERKKRETWLQFLWHVGDALAVLVSFVVGYGIRFHFPPFLKLFPLTKHDPGLALYVYAGLASLLVWIPVFHAMGLYAVRRGGRAPETGAVLRASLLAILLTAAATFFYRGVSFSRLTLVIVWTLSVLGILAGRRAACVLLGRRLRRHPIRFAVVGLTPQGRRVARALEHLEGLNYTFRGFLTGPGEASDGEATCLGPWTEARRVAQEERLDLLVFALPAEQERVVLEVLEACKDLDLDYEFVPDLLGLVTRTTQMEVLDGIPVIRLREIPLAGWNGVVKRTMDILFSAAGLVLLAPLMALIALAIKLDSPGPVFYVQERMGRDRRRFRMLKFRSMRVDAEADTGPVWAREGDERRTRVGRILREWSLDELPQLWNVLKGEMSLVGPRPERPYFVQRFEAAVPGYLDRHRVKSGMTGWAQVHGLRGNVPVEERTRYDLYYIENWSLWLDLRILFMTLRSVLTHRGT
jgi:exopolysaccharide biosynthesis polyprenyl glycosylphosphotransferase